jgi:hypothetical protein
MVTFKRCGRPQSHNHVCNAYEQTIVALVLEVLWFLVCCYSGILVKDEDKISKYNN